MRTREILRLPIGVEFNLIGSHSRYTIERFNSRMWFVRYLSDRSILYIHSSKEDVFEGERDILSFSMRVGSIYIHSDSLPYDLYKLELEPRSSFNKSFKK